MDMGAADSGVGVVEGGNDAATTSDRKNMQQVRAEGVAVCTCTVIHSLFNNKFGCARSNNKQL